MNSKEWAQTAQRHARVILRRKAFRKPFLAEQLLPAIVERIGPAPEPRNMGAVMRALEEIGAVHKVSYSRARTSHFSYKCLWSAA